jgi:ATP-dependent Lon protease
MSKAKAGQDQPVEIPDVLPILPLRNSVLFPGSIIPIDVGRRKSVRLVEDAIAKERPVIGILTQKDARTEDPNSGDLYLVGCAARILKVIKLAKDNFSVILQGVSRFEVTGFDGAEPFLAAKVRAVPDPTTSDVELDALVMNLKDIAKRVVKLMDAVPKEAGALVDSVTEPGHLADLITANLELEVGEKQDVLETFDIKTRTRKVLQFLSRQLEVLKVRERINTQVQEEMGRNQREYVLRQQLKAIKEELGELDDGGGDLDEFGEKILKAKMPEEAEKAAKKQLDRLKGMQPSSAEYTVTRTYLEWLVELPWSISTDDHIDLKEVRRCLDEDHYDLDKVKKRILEFLAVRKLADASRARSSCSAARPASARPRSVARSRSRSAASTSASRWAACATRPRSAATAARTSAPCPAASSTA